MNTLRATCLVVVFSLAGSAAAQTSVTEASEAQKNTAREAYQAGKTAFEKGDHATALAEFRRSHGAVASPNTKLMIAKSLAGMGKLPEAYEAYGEAVAEADESGDDKYAGALKTAGEEQAALEPKLGFVTVQIQGGAAGGTLNVGGREIPEAKWAAPVAVNPGQVDVALDTTEGHAEGSVTVAAGESKSLAVAAPAAAAEEAPVMIDPFAEAEDEGDAKNPLEERADIGLTIAGKVGAGIGKPISEFGVTPVFELELGFQLPLPDPVNHSLGLFFAGQYVQPQTDGKGAEPDPRLPGDGVLNYEITQQMLMLTFGLDYVIPVGSELLMPYGAIGGRAYFLNTHVKGDAGGAAFGENEELQADFGLYLAGGLDIFVGPGALLVELQFGYAAVDGFVLRETNVGGLNLAVGYRFVF